MLFYLFSNMGSENGNGNGVLNTGDDNGSFNGNSNNGSHNGRWCLYNVSQQFKIC